MRKVGISSTSKTRGAQAALIRCQASQKPAQGESSVVQSRRKFAFTIASSALILNKMSEPMRAEIVGGDVSNPLRDGLGSRRPGAGEAARVFAPSKEKKETDFQVYYGSGYTINLPMRGFNPSPPGMLGLYPSIDVMWQDYQTTDIAQVSVQVIDSGNKVELGDMPYLFGKDVWDCSNNQCNERYLEEQGFTTGSSVGSLMKSESTSVDGVTYKVYDVLTRYADGGEGGRWHLIKAASKDGKTYVMQFLGGEKHWTRNKSIAESTRDSFKIL